MKLNFQWKKPTGQFASGERLYLNRICVGFYDWHTMRDEPYWRGGIALPSLRDKPIKSNDETEIKREIERVVTSWFNEVFKDGE